jgi:glycyl-radical enzyme activating protein
MTGRVFDMQRFSIHDGPGIRTTVFLKGCPLRCAWCHNPEGIAPQPSLSFLRENCIGLGECRKVCPSGAIVVGAPAAAGPRAVLDRPECTLCGKCAEACDAKAFEMVGRETTAEEVLEVVVRDRDYYAGSGGGMTISGGEPMFQPEFVEALARAAKQRGIHCALETSGYAEWKSFTPLLPYIDLYLYDYKETDPKLHEVFIGQSNEKILANLRALHGSGVNILLRCPMIPEYNARKEHLNGIAAIVRELPNLKGVELLPYHRLGRAKLNRFGLYTRVPDGILPPDKGTVDGWVSYLTSHGIRTVNQVAVTDAACREMPFLCGAPEDRAPASPKAN